MSKITGGYYIKARKIQDSAIAKSPPHVREIWDWMLKTANHKDLKTYGVIIKRGQLFTSYHEIQEELSWKVGFIKKYYKKHNVDNAMVWLRHEQMITTQKTTRGLIVTICKYEYYQDPANYDKAYDNDNETTRLRQDSSTINKNDNNDKNKKININMPVAENFNGLPEIRIGAAIEFVRHTQRVELDSKQVVGLWEVFKIQNLTGKKWYKDDEDVYGYFLNWIKTQKFNNATAKPNTPAGGRNAGANQLIDKIKQNFKP